MRKPIKSQLVETTAIVQPIPTVGDNSGLSGHVLPMPQDIHNSIETTLDTMIANEKAIEYARQKLAYLLWERHDRMVADKPAGSVPFAHDLATDNAAFITYLDALAAEFTVADSPKLKVMTPEQRDVYGKRTRRRLSLALELFVRLAWFKTHNQDVPCEWNSDTGRWDIFPGAFVPPGFKAGGDLLMEADGKTPRRKVTMESEHAGVWYFVTRNRGSGTTINLSLDQFNHAFTKTLAVLRNPSLDTDTTEATPTRQRRAARQTAAQTEAAKVAAAADIAATDTDTPEADAAGATTDRQWALGQLVKNLVAVDKFLNHDALANLSWSDLPIDAVNSVTAICIAVDRMNAKPDGKKNAKPVARPAVKALDNAA
jgi:hypothetical protein